MDHSARLTPYVSVLRPGALVQPLVELCDLSDPPPPLPAIQRQDLVSRPVEVEGDVGYLLEQPLRGVANHSPTLPTSTSNARSHWGHLTVNRSWPFSLTRRYKSCRNARSPAYNPSTTFGLISVRSPRRVITRDRRMITR